MHSKSIDKAFKFASEAHKGQKRKFTDIEYVVHPIETANILWEATNHEATDDIIVSALLHDVVEDTKITIDTVEDTFGYKVKMLVSELTSVRKEQNKMGKKYYLLNKINNMSSDAFSIKLADRLSNISDLIDKKVPDDFVKKYSAETTFLLQELKRDTNILQKKLKKSIIKVLLFLTINRNIGR